MNTPYNEENSVFSIASRMEDILAGFEKAMSTVCVILELMSDECLSDNPSTEIITSRLETFINALYLAEDRLFDEKKQIISLTNELYTISKRLTNVNGGAATA